jgi:hypothetical protein
VGFEDAVGVLAHRGGLLAATPEVTVGVVRAVSRADRLEFELIARAPGDRIGPHRTRRPPGYGEGRDPRLGWLDGDGRVRWAYPARGSAPGHRQSPDSYFRATFALPPLFDEVSLVLAWPEIDFPETVITLPLPDQAAVDRATTSIWSPGTGTPVVADRWHRRSADPIFDQIDVESGTVVAGPAVLHGSEQAAVVLTRVTAVGALLSMEVLSVARGEVATAVDAHVFDPALRRAPQLRGPMRGTAALAVIHGSDAIRPHSPFSSSSGSPGNFACRTDFTLPNPATGTLDLLVSWPLAGLTEVRVHVDLDD